MHIPPTSPPTGKGDTVTPEEGELLSSVIISEEPNFISSNIAKGVNIWGVEGELEQSIEVTNGVVENKIATEDILKGSFVQLLDPLEASPVTSFYNSHYSTMQLVKIDDSHALYGYLGHKDGYRVGTAGTITIADDLTLTTTSTKMDSIGATTSTWYAKAIDVKMLSDNKFVMCVYYYANNNSYIVVGTIADDGTVTFGTALNPGNGYSCHGILPLSESKILYLA